MRKAELSTRDSTSTPCRPSKIETALLAYSKADFLVIKEFKTGGKFLVARTRRASNPYPKVFFVLTSVCVTRNDEEASLPPSFWQLMILPKTTYERKRFF